MSASLDLVRVTLAMLESEGWQPPAGIAAIRAAEAAALDPVPPRKDALARLVAAIPAGDVSEAQAAAIALASLPEGDSFPLFVNQNINAIVYDALMAAIPASDALAFLGGRFNAKAAELAQALKTQDPDTAPEKIALSSAKAREAWVAAPARAADLERLTQGMATVLRYMAGVILPDNLLALAVPYPGDEKRAAKIRAAWSTPTRSRAGRFGAVLAAGGTIAAPASPAAFARWPEPAPKGGIIGTAGPNVL
jgi:hypothetical protein